MRITQKASDLVGLLLAFRPATLLKETPTQVLSYKYCEISKSSYFEEHLRTAASERKLKPFYRV